MKDSPHTRHEYTAMTRRTLLELIGRTGGASALSLALSHLDLAPVEPPAGTTTAGSRFHLDGESGKGRRVAILGAGLAGMCVAYELGRAGYDCRILEARGRPGGRCHTIRRGTTEVETDGVTQTCTFDDGQYLNPGPARIPQHHVTLDYCREFDIEVQPFAQINEAAYCYREGESFGVLSGKRIRKREAEADLYGYISELLYKSLGQSVLDQEITAEDRQRLRDFLAEDGGLSGNGKYQSSPRRGYREWPTVGERPGVLDDPYSLHDLLQARIGFTEDHNIDWEPILFQIVGGNDGIARAFAKRLERRITYHAEVCEIRQSVEGGVRIVYRDIRSGKRGGDRTVTADYCICTIPLTVLKDIPADFSPAFRSAIARVRYSSTAKIGLQYGRRFWEEDDGIYGGITRTNLPITQIFYPSHGFLGRKGVLVGSYCYGGTAQAFGDLSPAERTKWVVGYGSRIHPACGEKLESAFSVSWQKVPYSLGGWAEGGGESFRTLSAPDGRIYLAGEHLSYLGAWMAGALESARFVARNLHERASKESGVAAV